MLSVKNFSKSQRKSVIEGVRNGSYTLKVNGSQSTGFGLVAKRGQALVNVFGKGRTFTKQGEAVAFGERKFGVKATKLVAPRAKKAKEAAAEVEAA